MSQPQRSIQLLILDDQALVRESLAQALSAEHDIAIAAHHATLQETIATLSSTPVDVVILDYKLDGDHGAALFEWVRNSGFRGHILVVAASLSLSDAQLLIRNGVSGIFLKENPLDRLVEAVRTVAAGGNWLDQRFLEGLADPDDGPLLTDRERVLLRYLIEGCSNKEIGAHLQLSESAVKAMLHRLFDKTGVRTRGQLIRIALEKYRPLL